MKLRPQDQHAAFRALMRWDFPAFVERVFRTVRPETAFVREWAMQAVAHATMETCRGATRRLVINLPPRCSKSLICSVALPAFLLGQDPTMRIVCVSYSKDLAEALARDFITVLESAWYRNAFRKTRISQRRRAVHDIATTQLGGRFSTSVGGTFTGRGGDLIIIDDPMNPEHARSETERANVRRWMEGTLSSRLDDPRTGKMIMVMQRLHDEDATAHVLAKGGWTHLEIPAIAQRAQTFDIGGGRTRAVKEGEHLFERFTPDVLDQFKRDLGSQLFSAQYLQEPVPADGDFFKAVWFQNYEAPPQEGIVVQSWDTASGDGENADYSVCTTWIVKKKRCYLLHVWRGRLTYPELKKKIIALRNEWKVGQTLIENAASGRQLIQDLRNDPEFRGIPLGITPKDDKQSRAGPAAAMIESGEILFPADAPWLAALKKELLQFPNASHDDQVDSISQFAKWFRKTYSGTGLPDGYVGAKFFPR